MEEYCKKENIFFNESDRIKHQIKKSKGLYQEFKGSLQRGFKNFKHIADHPNLEALLTDTKDKDEAVSDNAADMMSPSGATDTDF